MYSAVPTYLQNKLASNHTFIKGKLLDKILAREKTALFNHIKMCTCVNQYWITF